MTHEPGVRRRFSGVAVALAGFALGFGPLFLILGYLGLAPERRQLVFNLCGGAGLFIAALTLGLGAHFDRLRTDGGRIALFPDEAASTPRSPFAEALREAMAAAWAFVQKF